MGVGIGARAKAPDGFERSSVRAPALVEARKKARDRATEQLGVLKQEYSSTGLAVSASFRNLVGPLPASDLTHSLHPYPARLLRQVPRFFLACRQLVDPGDLILDPFCGSGTVLLESVVTGHDAWGVDANPFARLLSDVKTKPLGHEGLVSTLDAAIREAKRRRAFDSDRIVNPDLWFSSSAQSVLGRFACAVRELDTDDAHRRYLLLTLSLAADRLSLRDRRIPVPVRARDAARRAATQTTVGGWNDLQAVGLWIAKRVDTLDRDSSNQVWVRGEDARAMMPTRQEFGLTAPQLIITSPPYGSAQKYIRSSSLSLGWLDLAGPTELASLERKTIGREHITRSDSGHVPLCGVQSVDAAVARIAERDPIRGTIYANYFADMFDALHEMYAVSSESAHLVLVVGPNTVAGEPLATHDHVAALAARVGFVLELEVMDQIRGRALMTKRASTAGTPINVEHVYLFRKWS